MYRISLILYGNAQSCEIAKGLLLNQAEVKMEEVSNNPWKVNLILSERLNENSLIPLLRKSGIHGFRLVENRNYRSSRNGSPFCL